MPPSSWCRDYFHRGDKRYKNDQFHWENRCKACVVHRTMELEQQDKEEVNMGTREYVRQSGELKEQALNDVPAIAGKTERWLSHLSKCAYVAHDVRILAQSGKKPSGTEAVRMSRVQQVARAAVLQIPRPPELPCAPHAGPMSVLTAGFDAMALNIPNPMQPESSPAPRHVMWESSKQDEFAADLCKLFISCNMAFRSASNPQLNLFFSKYIPQAKVPDRRVLSGRVLDVLVVQAEMEMKSHVAGKLATGQCDGYKTTAKASVVTTSITVEVKLYMIAAHDISPEKKTADNLLEIVLRDIKYCEDELGVVVIAYCTDNGGDARGMRTKLKRVRPKLTVPPCWGHQVNLVVGEVIELRVACMNSIDGGLEIVKWFTNHSRALGLLKEHQKTTERFKTTSRTLTLIFPVITRWTYHYLAVRRLLTLSATIRTLYINEHDTLIECAGSKRDAKDRAKEVLSPIEDPQFWKNLTEVKTILEPLAIAAKCMQAPDAGLDQVLLMLGNLYRIYSSSDINSRVGNSIRKSLEKRWLVMEREVFILAVFLNPYIRCSAFAVKNAALRPVSLYHIAKKLFARFFDEEPDLNFHEAFFDYSRDSKEFSSSWMHLAELKQLHERENKHVNVVKVWDQLDTGETNGRNGLVKLAIWVLSIVANSAGSERGFSKFGIFLTKLRNQLSLQKVRKMNTVDMDLKRQHEELGLTTDRLKRKFAKFADKHADEGSTEPSYDTTDSFTHLSTQLIADLTADRDEPIDEEEEEDNDGISTVYPRSCYTLKELFQYPEDDAENTGNIFGFHWAGGVKDLQEELELYDLLMEEMDD
ncbi:ribonuclease H-like domain-containing protein [Mycena vitilis]|nr:ribonuclease H-like domain-containing protein [Mycena vitilis]